MNLDYILEAKPDAQRKEGCPRCGSKDNLVIYEYHELGVESYHCFTPGCDMHLSTLDAYKKKGKEVAMPYKLPPHRNSINFTNRGIIAQTSNKYQVVGITEGEHKGNIAFPYYKGGQLVAVKYRTPDKKFYWQGDNKAPMMFGTHTINSNTSCKAVILTEGEFDALAVYQMTGIPALSVPNGADGAAKAVKANLELLEQFEKVYLAFDSDEPGKLAQAECLKLLRPGVGKSVSLDDYKDPCEVLKADDAETFKQYLKNAEEITSDYLLEDLFWYENTFSPMPILRTDILPTGIIKLDERLKLLQEEVTTIYSDPSVGKSSLIRQIAANLIRMKKTVLVFCFEESARTTWEKIMRMACDGNMALDRKEYVGNLRQYLKIASCFSYDLDRIKNTIEYGVRSHDVDVVIFDNVTACTASEDNSYISTNLLYKLFTDLGKQFKHHTLAVSHTKRDNNVKSENGDIPSMKHCINSGHAERLSHNMVALGRKEGTDVLKVAIKKQRDTGETSEFELEFDKSIYCFKGLNYDIIERFEGSTESEGKGSVRLENGGDNPPSGESDRESDNGEDTDSPPPVRGRDNPDSPHESRLQDSITLWEIYIPGSKGSPPRLRQTKTTKFTNGRKRELVTCHGRCQPLLAEVEKIDFPRLGQEIWIRSGQREFFERILELSRDSRFDIDVEAEVGDKPIGQQMFGRVLGAELIADFLGLEMTTYGLKPKKQNKRRQTKGNPSS